MATQTWNHAKATARLLRIAADLIGDEEFVDIAVEVVHNAFVSYRCGGKLDMPRKRFVSIL